MKKLVAETRVWFGTLGWAVGYAVARQYPKYGFSAFLIGLAVYLVLYIALAVILDTKYGND